MNNQSPPTVFHPGEIAVQQRAGVREQARRLVGMLGSPDLEGDRQSSCPHVTSRRSPVATRTPCYGYPR